MGNVCSNNKICGNPNGQKLIVIPQDGNRYLSHKEIEVNEIKKKLNIGQLPETIDDVRQYYHARKQLQITDPGKVYGKPDPNIFGVRKTSNPNLKTKGLNQMTSNMKRNSIDAEMSYRSIQTSDVNLQNMRNTMQNKSKSLIEEQKIVEENKYEEAVESPMTSPERSQPTHHTKTNKDTKDTIRDSLYETGRESFAQTGRETNGRISRFSINTSKQRQNLPKKKNRAVRYKLLENKKQRHDSSHSNDHKILERYGIKTHKSSIDIPQHENRNQFQNDIAKPQRRYDSIISPQEKNGRSSSQNMLLTSMEFGDTQIQQQDSNSQGIVVKLQNMNKKNTGVPSQDNNSYHQNYQNKGQQILPQANDQSKIPRSQSYNNIGQFGVAPLEKNYDNSHHVSGGDSYENFLKHNANIKRNSSIFSFSKWNLSSKNIKRHNLNPKVNMKFLQQFQILFEEIKNDLQSRVDEIKEIYDVSKISDEYQNNLKLQKDQKPEFLSPKHSFKLNMQSLGVVNNDLHIITDRDETTDRTEINAFDKKKLNNTISTESLNEPVFNRASPQPAMTPREITIFQLLTEELDWDIIEQINEMIENLIDESSVYFDQAQYALNKVKEKELIDLFYTDILKIDQLIGTFEIKINDVLDDVMEQWIKNTIKVQSIAIFQAFQNVKSTQAATNPVVPKKDKANVGGNSARVEGAQENSPTQQFGFNKSQVEKSLVEINFEEKPTSFFMHRIVQSFVGQFTEQFQVIDQKNIREYLKNNVIEKHFSSNSKYSDVVQKQKTLNQAEYQVLKEEKHLYQLWKIQQLQSVTDKQNQNNPQLKQKFISEILAELDKNIAEIDFEYDELKEQQLCVDISIEKFFKKIPQYPKSLKKLFDQGTHLLSQFESFYHAWYLFQCEVQQKFYNYIYSNEQKLILSQLQSSFQIKQLERVVMQFHSRNQEFLKIKRCFKQFQTEILSQNQILFHNTDKIIQQCQNLFGKIGVMDFYGLGTMISNNTNTEQLKGGKKDSSEIFSGSNSVGMGVLNITSPALSAELQLGEIIQKKQNSKLTPMIDTEKKYCQLDIEVKQLCQNVTNLNNFQSSIKAYFQLLESNVNKPPEGIISIMEKNYLCKGISEPERNQLNHQIKLTFQEFVSQQFDQIFNYTHYKHQIDSCEDSNLKFSDIPSGQLNQSPINQALNLKNKPLKKQSFDYRRVLSSDNSLMDASAKNMGVRGGRSSKDFIEFDLIIVLCGVELNLISLKSQVKLRGNNRTQNDIYQREWYLNLNHISEIESEQLKQQKQKPAPAASQQKSEETGPGTTNSSNITHVNNTDVFDNKKFNNMFNNFSDPNAHQTEKQSTPRTFIKQTSSISGMAKNLMYSVLKAQNTQQMTEVKSKNTLGGVQNEEEAAMPQMQLIPLGVALHHLLESQDMLNLFDNIKNLCLNEINQMINQIEKQIDGVNICNCNQ